MYKIIGILDINKNKVGRFIRDIDILGSVQEISKIIEKNEGEIIKIDDWGLLNMSHEINKNKKGNYIHFKLKGNGLTVLELENNEKIDKDATKIFNRKSKKTRSWHKLFWKKRWLQIIKKMKRKKKNNSKRKTSSYSKLNLFQKPGIKFFRPCPLSGKEAPLVDYKNIKLLKRYMSETGRILPSRITSVSQNKQKKLSRAIKRARLLALL